MLPASTDLQPRDGVGRCRIRSRTLARSLPYLVSTEEKAPSSMDRPRDIGLRARIERVHDGPSRAWANESVGHTCADGTRERDYGSNDESVLPMARSRAHSNGA